MLRSENMEKAKFNKPVSATRVLLRYCLATYLFPYPSLDYQCVPEIVAPNTQLPIKRKIKLIRVNLLLNLVKDSHDRIKDIYKMRGKGRW